MLIGIVGTILGEADPLIACPEVTDLLTCIDLVSLLLDLPQPGGFLCLDEQLWASDKLLLVGDGGGEGVVAAGALGRHGEVLALVPAAARRGDRRALHFRRRARACLVLQRLQTVLLASASRALEAGLLARGLPSNTALLPLRRRRILMWAHHHRVAQELVLSIPDSHGLATATGWPVPATASPRRHRQVRAIQVGDAVHDRVVHRLGCCRDHGVLNCVARPRPVVDRSHLVSELEGCAVLAGVRDVHAVAHLLNAFHVRDRIHFSRSICM